MCWIYPWCYGIIDELCLQTTISASKQLYDERAAIEKLIIVISLQSSVKTGLGGCDVMIKTNLPYHQNDQALNSSQINLFQTDFDWALIVFELIFSFEKVKHGNT